MLRLYPIVGTLTLVATSVGRPPPAAAAPPTTVPSVSQLVCPEPSEPGQPATPGARPNDELMAGETFQRAMTDVLRLSIAVRFCELRPDTLTPGMYSCGNQMLFATLLRSMVISSFDDVAPSFVKGTPCFPTVRTNGLLCVHCT